MRKIIFVAQTDETRRKEALETLDEIMDVIRERAEKLRAALVEDRLNEYMPPKRDERMTFNDWWNEGEVSPGNNPYRHESAAYWAWEGWQAGVKAEREACAVLVEQLLSENPDLSEVYIAAEIRARGQDE